MSEQFSQSLDFFILVMTELAVLFIAISFLVSVINHYLPANKIKKLLSGSKGYSIAIGLGAVTPFCSCSTLPMTIGLIQARAAFGPVMAFLLTSPLLNPFIVGLFWVSFGAKVTMIYAIFVIFFAILSGYLLEKLRFDRFIRREILGNSCSKNSCQDNQVESEVEPTLFSDTGKKLILGTINQFVKFAPYMAIGVAVGAVLHGYVPSESFAALAKIDLVFLIPLTAVVGVFLYVRASTMVPIATSLIAKGMSLGAVISLTVAGAGASLPEMIMMKKMFHWPLLLAFIFVVFSTACFTGFAIELL